MFFSSEIKTTTPPFSAKLATLVRFAQTPRLYGVEGLHHAAEKCAMFSSMLSQGKRQGLPSLFKHSQIVSKEVKPSRSNPPKFTSNPPENPQRLQNPPPPPAPLLNRSIHPESIQNTVTHSSLFKAWHPAKWIRGTLNLADIFTKNITAALLNLHRSRLGFVTVRDSPAESLFELSL